LISDKKIYTQVNDHKSTIGAGKWLICIIENLNPPRFEHGCEGCIVNMALPVRVWVAEFLKSLHWELIDVHNFMYSYL